MTSIKRVIRDKQEYYKITDSDSMRPFFMSIVSDANHWMFVSSNGGLTAGRKNSDYALFPYYTDDKITESSETTGSKSIIRVDKGGKKINWEPFSIRGENEFAVTRNLYKRIYGNQIIFEEVNAELGLSFHYRWSTSEKYGFVRTSTLINNNDYSVRVSLIDGIQNILPYGVGSDLQNQSSNLVDAYKRSELHRKSGLGIFSLSAIIVDKAEPSEALKANTVWSAGLENPVHLLSAQQLESFRQGQSLRQETDVKGEKGAYFLHQEITLTAQDKQAWNIVANVNQSHVAIEQLIHDLGQPSQLIKVLEGDIERGTEQLVALTAAADGLQLTAEELVDTRNFSNVLFNIMRGGIFDDNYKIGKKDFIKHLHNANKTVRSRHEKFTSALTDEFTLFDLKSRLEGLDDPDLQRLAIEYLPLKFSRRHGDPSRPWNKFSINTHDEEDGSKILDYQGNWRDIFQNWEALAHSYPEFIEGMIFKFLNASTFDGYNPYRVMKDGFDWETIEEDNPWSYIGYWGDHQIIYLLKFLEFAEKHRPGILQAYFSKKLFVYANVPYKIKSYQDILKNPKDTVVFDGELDVKVRKSRAELGADGALVRDQNGGIYRVNFIEKILASLLAKTANFIPEGGIWLNTQRPEWNDANNALVGNGVSMVTLCYLRRFFNFFRDILADGQEREFTVSSELAEFYQRTHEVFQDFSSLLGEPISDQKRKSILDGLGQSAADFRNAIYADSFSGKVTEIDRQELLKFIDLVLACCDHTIAANRRGDGLYHSYNLMTVEEDGGISIAHLNEMLEGQVAVLSAAYLDHKQVLSVLDGLKNSKLFRKDQYSYLLYPDKDLPGFLEKNKVPSSAVANSVLLSKLIDDGDKRIIQKDINGDYHFNGNFKNVGDLKLALANLEETKYKDLAKQAHKELASIFEAVFNHKEFTGRSGTFFGYEGLGSIYWHMVSKLRFAVVECCLRAIRENAGAEITGRLLEHYYEITAGIGVQKSPELYGAFPTDPYSHTPAGRGAQQPGMTGQVKEDLLSRFRELGISVKDGQLGFSPVLLRQAEFTKEPMTFHYVDVNGQADSLASDAGSVCFTYCQVPVNYVIGKEAKLTVSLRNGEDKIFVGGRLDQATSNEIFKRTGKVKNISVLLTEEKLK